MLWAPAPKGALALAHSQPLVIPRQVGWIMGLTHSQPLVIPRQVGWIMGLMLMIMGMVLVIMAMVSCFDAVHATKICRAMVVRTIGTDSHPRKKYDGDGHCRPVSESNLSAAEVFPSTCDDSQTVVSVFRPICLWCSMDLIQKDKLLVVDDDEFIKLR